MAQVSIMSASSFEPSTLSLHTVRFSYFVILFTIFVTSCDRSDSGIGKPAPDVQFRTLQGEVLSLRAMGTPVLVNFWSTSCTICIAEMPELVALYNDYQPKGFELIGVALPSDRPDQVLKLSQDKALPYPIAIDIDGEVIKAFEPVRATPTTFLIAPDGTVVSRHVGRVNITKLRAAIDELLI
ncbi:MAG: TlpA family protein disulfide reductase [Gammaproteobacteria bacterium]|nr:TlpA family protein disulfide reductase [Gammaproteobacteria bacterium]